MLGTVIDKGKIRHICDECCAIFEKKLREEEDKRIMQALRGMND